MLELFFGGSIYGALDPIYMVQLINILGGKYVVWDKAATIKFIRPIKKRCLPDLKFQMN